MPRYHVIAMDDGLAAEVRATRKAPDYPHPAHAEVATTRRPASRRASVTRR